MADEKDPNNFGYRMGGTSFYPFISRTPDRTNISSSSPPIPSSSTNNTNTFNMSLQNQYSNPMLFGQKGLVADSLNYGMSLGSNTSLAATASMMSQSMPSTLLNGKQGIVGPHYQKQMDQANLSRTMASQHYHSRMATTAARAANNQSTNQSTNSLGQSASALGSVPHMIIGDTPTQGILEKVESSQWEALDLGGMGLINISRDLFKYNFLTHLYINHNNLTSISPEISRLKSLNILDLSSNKLTTLPPEVGLLSHLTELWLFDNQITYLPPELGQLYQLEMLGIEGNMIGDPLESLVMKEGTSAAIAFLRDTCPVKPMPAEREWIQLEDQDQSNPDTITFMCYNTLCEKYATPQAYAYTPSWALAWHYRKDLLLQDILNYNADIVCLQEVEAGQFEEFFLDQLSQLGDYSGVFYPKSRSKTMSEADRRSVDGCATFYKKDKFKLLDKCVIEFQQIAMQRPDLRKTEDAFNRVMIKDNIAVATFLEQVSTQQAFLVCNAHLHWDPAYKDVKLIQTAMLLEEIQKLAKEWDPKMNIPIILSGDFNSLPDSGVVEYLTQGSVSNNHDDLGSYSYGEYTSNGLSHSLSLKSAYSHIDSIDFTNFTPTFKGIIDYIWYTKNNLSVCGMLSHVDREYLKTCVGFPNAHHPSDHIPLVVSIKSKKSK